MFLLSPLVMAGLDPAIHVLPRARIDVDARDPPTHGFGGHGKPGHDERRNWPAQRILLTLCRF
jgi:hypothetical protein